jgi:hypothetical protein
MRALGAGIHVFFLSPKDVDGRDKPAMTSGWLKVYCSMTSRPRSCEKRTRDR